MTKLTVEQRQNVNLFLAFLENRAKSLEDTAGYNGAYNDGGASALRDKAGCFSAGLEGRMPESLESEYKAFLRLNDPEYAEYQRLKGKFE